jgi:hypothetical protein
VPAHWRAKISSIDPAEIKPEARLGRRPAPKKVAKETTRERVARLDAEKRKRRLTTTWKEKHSKKAKFANRPYKLVPENGTKMVTVPESKV